MDFINDYAKFLSRETYTAIIVVIVVLLVTYGFKMYNDKSNIMISLPGLTSPTPTTTPLAVAPPIPPTTSATQQANIIQEPPPKIE